MTAAKLFPEPQPAEVQLSRAYAASPYRGSAANTPTFYSCSSAVACDECLARQHESYGTTAHGRTVRPKARYKRVMPGHQGAVLFLCGADAERWRERDLADGVTTR